ncbi:MoaD/ThiS family protein [Qipengyuania vesicularis]|uniref:MoaD/ThiS family protein n=1 Tax=Qipengyuania vesicularis TaxID=2867232 RepID=UPI001C86981B|nr:MoaD/ThiS family protein [Qipengyuania vesicularis]MBX7526312.1 MoaD/ThiS family protein [Qipengyuania vesicularis]
MSVTILFLGPLRDLAGRQEIEVDAPLDWAGLLAAVGPEVAEQLEQKRVNVACRGRVRADKRALLAEDGDEVALLPPVSGG